MAMSSGLIDVSPGIYVRARQRLGCEQLIPDWLFWVFTPTAGATSAVATFPVGLKKRALCVSHM